MVTVIFVYFPDSRENLMENILLRLNMSFHLKGNSQLNTVPLEETPPNESYCVSSLNRP